MLTVKKLLRGVGTYWTPKPRDDLSSLEILSWHAAADLASLVEVTIEAEDLPTIWPSTWTLLFGLESYFAEIKQPLSQSHALVMLLIERKMRGLTPRGNDTKPSPKPS